MSKILVVCEAVVEINGGKYYNNGLDAMVNNYGMVFNDITCLNYGIEKKRPTNNEVKGRNVHFVICSKQNSILNFYKNRNANKLLIAENVKKVDACIIHMPSTLGGYTIEYAKKYRKPYLLVVVGCAWDALWNHSWKGKCIAPMSYYFTKQAISQSAYVLYVTKYFLQGRYPSRGYTIACSDVDLPNIDDNILQNRLSHIELKKHVFKIATLGTVASPYKGQKYVIAAMEKLVKKGYSMEYYIVGGGDCTSLKKIAVKLGVDDNIKFLGNIKHEQVFHFLDEMDLYIQPSKTEGLPRALIEAMARGLPALGSRVGGIPELLDSDYLFSKGDVNAISTLIENTFLTPRLLRDASMQNFERSKYYLKDYLVPIRLEFLKRFAAQIEM